MAGIDVDVVVNVQGDESMLDPTMIKEVVTPFHSDAALEMSTIKRRVLEESDFADPSVVKVVTDPRRRTADFQVFEHVGLYAYTREFLFTLVSLKPTDMEEMEGREQLRALENGIRILVVKTRCEGSCFPSIPRPTWKRCVAFSERRRDHDQTGA